MRGLWNFRSAGDDTRNVSGIRLTGGYKVSIQEIEAQTRSFLMSNFIFDASVHLSADDSLMENSIIDSTGVLEVIMWLETSFGINVEDSEVLPENLDSIRCMTTYIDRKLQANLMLAS